MRLEGESISVRSPLFYLPHRHIRAFYMLIVVDRLLSTKRGGLLPKEVENPLFISNYAPIYRLLDTKVFRCTRSQTLSNYTNSDIIVYK